MVDEKNENAPVTPETSETETPKNDNEPTNASDAPNNSETSANIQGTAASGPDGIKTDETPPLVSNSGKSITRSNLLSWISTILLISGCFTIFFIYEKYTVFENTTKTINKCILSNDKDNLKQSVNNVLKYINYQNSLVDGADKQSLQQIKKQTIASLKKINFGESGKGKVIVLDSKGNVLVHPQAGMFEGKNILGWTDDNGRHPFGEIIRSKNPSKSLKGEIVEYQTFNSRKNRLNKIIVYSKLYKPWGWTICSELDTGKKKRFITQNSRRLQIDLIMEIVYLCILSIAVTLIAIRFSYGVSQSIKKEITMLVDYFKKSASSSDTSENGFSEKNFQFREFSFIAGSAIAMVNKIHSLIERIKELAIKAETGSQAKSTYLSNIHYGIRTPLSGIMGMSQILRKSKLSDTQKEYVDEILLSGQTIVEIIDDVENFSSIEDGHMKINSEPFDLSQVCDQVIATTKKKAAQKNLSVKLDIEKNTPSQLVGDSSKISQILLHLVENAIIFSNEGIIHIQVCCNKQENDKVFIEFKVNDAGIGISQDKLKSIFDFYSRELVSTTQKFSVVSLGLSVCKSMVESMNGTIDATSEEGKGSTFLFTIPLAIATDEQIKEIPVRKELALEPEAEPRSALEGIDELEDTAIIKTKSGEAINVLLAEDDPVNRNVAQIFLTRAGCEVDIAANGQEAVDKVAESSYDIVFMDCEMPQMDGYDATKTIRETETGNKHLPIVALTAHTAEVDRQRGMDVGMDDYLKKPFTSESLKVIIDKFVNK